MRRSDPKPQTLNSRHHEHMQHLAIMSQGASKKVLELLNMCMIFSKSWPERVLHAAAYCELDAESEDPLHAQHEQYEQHVHQGHVEDGSHEGTAVDLCHGATLMDEIKGSQGGTSSTRRTDPEA